MTVCIGAISYWAPAEGRPASNAIVIASDRMITTGGFIQSEHDVGKIKFITSRICVMIAGDTSGATTLTERLITKFGLTSSSSVEEVALEAKTIYEELRRDTIDTVIFHPRGITMSQFYQGGLQSKLQPSLVGGIDDEVMSYDYGIALIIAGCDKTGAHLYMIGNPGTISNHQDTGYTSIGSGEIHAIQSLIGFRHSYFHSLFETIYAVYASKKRAEAAPGVGPATDMFIIPPITEAEAAYLTAKQIEKLDGIYKQFNQPVSAEINERLFAINLFGEEEENETQEQPGASAKPASKKVHSEADVQPKG